MDRFEEKRNRTREVLLQTALELFATNGYDCTSIRQIADKADVSLGLLYNYFPGKEALLREIFRLGFQDIQASFQPDETMAGLPPVEVHIKKTVQLLQQNRHFWKLLHGMRMQNEVVRELQQEIASETQFIHDHLVRNLAELGITDPETEAQLLFATIDGMAQHYLFFDDYPLEEVAEKLIRKYEFFNLKY